MSLLGNRTRPARGRIDEAALELLARHGAQILATARRYAATPEDAEDAYQRGLEILLTKAPTTNEDELVPWLKTVVKHEAFALRRQRDRHAPVSDDGDLSDRPAPSTLTHDQAERLEQLHQGAEALRRLKPQEVRALLLRAEGYSYAEICELTGWSYTKVNRCLSEGRQALTVRLAGIEGGIECVRMAPLLSALADGEAKAEDLAVLRPHMKTCLACRARLKQFREAPARVAALLPPAALAAGDGGGLRTVAESALGTVQQKAESALGAAQHKAALLGERAHAAAELATGQKIAAVAASAAALAGGGSAVDQFANHQGPPLPAPTEQVEAQPVHERAPVESDPPAEPVPLHEQPVVAPPAPSPAPEPAPPPPPPPAPPPPPPPNPATEFAPAKAPAPAPAPATPAPASRPAAPPASAGGGGPSEFAP